MNKKISIFDLYSKFFFYFSKKQKIRTIFAFFLGILSSFLELISVGLIVPFVLLITNPEKIYEFSLYKTIVGEKIFLINELVLLSIVFFISIVIISTFLKLVHLKLNCLVSYDIIRTFADIFFQKVLDQQYITFQTMNTKDVVTTISLRSQNIGESNFYIITLLSSLTTVFFLLINIIYFAPFKIVFFLFIISFLYFFFWSLIKKKVNNISKIYSENFQKLNKNITEMMSSYSDIILYRLHDFFLSDFRRNNDLLRNSQGQIVFLSSYPLIVIQSVIITIFIAFIYFLHSYKILTDQLPFVVLLVFSVQRMMPNVQTVFSSYTNLMFFKENLKKNLLLLNLQSKRKKKIDKRFASNIEKNHFEKINLQNIKFSYLEEKKILFNNCNLEIKKGEKIALIGESGSGKSTLVKIILGFLEPGNGHVFINNKKLKEENLHWWHSVVAYIPQKIFILDENLYENIALKKNISKKEKEEIDRLLIMLNLSDLLSFSKKHKTKSRGEDGKQFSGGQIQRIAVARALFQNRKFIILDEAFNALDKENILNIMNILNKISSLTILIITHSDDIVKKCKKIIKIKNKKIYEIKIS